MYPKMLGEVIEALESYYCDEKDVLIDCLLYLENSTCSEDDVLTIKQWFRDHDRCANCGNELEVYSYKEPHNECENGAYEVMTELYCPNCVKDFF